MNIIKPSVDLIDSINATDVYKKIELCARVCYQSHSKGDTEDFIRGLIERGHESVLEHVSLTFHIICDRAIMAELTRHRLASFSVESTRYCKYDELTFITPTAPSYCEAVEELYKDVILNGASPEEARALLPLCLKSELYMTANLREWRHILRLRSSKHSHPQMRFIAHKIINILTDKLPVIFEDFSEVPHDY